METAVERRSTFKTEIDISLVATGGRLDDETDPVIGVGFHVVNRSLVFLTPQSSFERGPAATSVRHLSAAMADFSDEDTASQTTSDMLSIVEDVRPHLVPQLAPLIARTLSCWTHQALQTGFSSMAVEILVETTVRDYCYDTTNADAHLEGEEEEETATSSSAPNRFYLDDDDDDNGELEDAAMDWVTTESMNMQPVSSGMSLSSSQVVEAFLESCRAKIWDSKAHCAICLEFLGGEDEKGKEEEEEEIICLPCSHCFHEACIKTWFEESDRCPLCRRTVMDHP